MPAATKPVSLEQLVALNDEIVALVRAGVPLELGLQEMGADAGGTMAEISTALASRMMSGASLPEALHAEEQRFPPMYRTVVEAGLRAGRLSAALEAVSNFARELVELRRQVGRALIYPLIVVGLAYGLFVVFTTDMAARFREAYEVFRLPLHGPLLWLTWVADRTAEWWWIPPLGLVGLIVWWASTGGAHLLTFSGSPRIISWIPGVGKIGRDFQYATFAELLALLIEHDVPLTEGLRLAADAAGNSRLRGAAHRFADVIERGGKISETDQQKSALPPFLYWVLWQASQGVRPARLLRHAASLYRRRAINLTNWFKVTFPVLAAVVIGGGVTALYALALFGPLTTFLSDLAPG